MYLFFKDSVTARVLTVPGKKFTFQLSYVFEWATVISLLKNWPVKFRHVIFGLSPYANEEWRHIFQILKHITLGICLPGVTAFRG